MVLAQKSLHTYYVLRNRYRPILKPIRGALKFGSGVLARGKLEHGSGRARSMDAQQMHHVLFYVYQCEVDPSAALRLGFNSFCLDA